ncbi:MAG TPA: multicopper oxidase domain-containing protein [Rhizomicrobium sp.]|jgi:FtsP/CotA-like multicopper oxidase with cupredoxin domain
MSAFASRFRTAILAFVLFATFPCFAFAGTDPCPRPVLGSAVKQPPDIYSQNGVLLVTLNYYNTVDAWGRTLFCYVTPDGLESPTLHVNPGDTIDLTLNNMESGRPLGAGVETVSAKSTLCGSFYMSPLTVNLHFHGLNVTPKCHGDNVVRTLVNPGESFEYKFTVPTDEPPGMYWYHQHVHGISSPAVQGGASGAIEVEGIANLQPAVAGLPQRFIVLRDQPLAYPPSNGNLSPSTPFWDVSINYVPISYPKYIPAVIKMQPGAQEFWRVVNAAADTVMDLVVLYDGKPQPLQIVALDGVPTGSHDGHHKGTIITQNDILIPTAGRAEFIVTGPSSNVKSAVLFTKKIDTGPAGDNDTARPFAVIKTTHDTNEIPKAILPTGIPVQGQRFDGLSDSMVTAHRELYFSEAIHQDKKRPGASGAFFITVEGQSPVVYNANNPPAVVTTRGAVEDWVIENHAHEVHEFHMHQIHFQLLAVNGKPVPTEQRQFYDTYQVGYLPAGQNGPYPKIKVRMDFRGAVVGEFVYHCHILDHEDQGMMANIQVLPRGTAIPRAAGGGQRAGTQQSHSTKVGARGAAARA